MPWRLIRTQDAPVTWLNRHCIICFTGPESRDEWVDGGVDTDEGAQLICRPCAVELGNDLGLVSTDAVDELLCRALEAEQENDRLTEELAETSALLAALRRYDASHPSLTDSAAPVADPGSAPSSAGPDDSIDERIEAVDSALDDLATSPVVPQGAKVNRQPRR